MSNFLYVFSEKERDKLLALHFNLLKSDESKHMYVFENRSELHFNLGTVDAVPSDTLTF